jgi:transposase InsO family protein
MGYKGRYAGCHMTTYGVQTPLAGMAARLASRTGNLTAKAREKLKVYDWYIAHGKNVSLTSRHFGYSRLSIRRWIGKVKMLGPVGLNEKSKRPNRVRRPTTNSDTIEQICYLRKKYPAWSKYKIGTLVRKVGFLVSNSTVGRVIKRKGFINPKVSRKRQKAALSPRRRFPKGLKIQEAGQLIQIDVKHIMLPGGRRHYQFTAIDVLSKERVLDTYSSESSRNASLFLEICLKEFSSPIKAIQTDNGAPFQKEFEMACRKHGIDHFFIEPRQPKQNSYVEISHEADDREFYNLGNVYIDFETQRAKLKEWQKIWNEVRPHQALGYLTPMEYLSYLKSENSKISPIILQT